MNKSIQGKKVYVKSNSSEWGVVVDHIEEDVYVAMFEDHKEVRLFERKELTVPREQ